MDILFIIHHISRGGGPALRALEMTNVLRKMGHDVLFASDGYYMKLPREAGFEVLSIKTISPDRVLACSRSGRTNWYDYNLLKECVTEDIKLFDQVKPDLVLGDFRLSLSTSCELASIPLAVTLNAAWTNYYTVRIKAPEHFRVTRILGKRITTWIAPWLKTFIITFDSLPYRRLRREMGLNPPKNIWDIWKGDLNLLVDIPEYGPTRSLPVISTILVQSFGSQKWILHPG